MTAHAAFLLPCRQGTGRVRPRLGPQRRLQSSGSSASLRLGASRRCPPTGLFVSAPPGLGNGFHRIGGIRYHVLHEATSSSRITGPISLTKRAGSAARSEVISITVTPASRKAFRLAASRWRRRTPKCHKSLSYSSATGGDPGYPRSRNLGPSAVVTFIWRCGSGKPASVRIRATRSSHPLSVSPRWSVRSVRMAVEPGTPMPQ